MAIPEQHPVKIREPKEKISSSFVKKMFTTKLLNLEYASLYLFYETVIFCKITSSGFRDNLQEFKNFDCSWAIQLCGLSTCIC